MSMPADLEDDTPDPLPEKTAEEKTAEAKRDREERYAAERAKAEALRARERRLREIGLDAYLAEVEAERVQGVAEARGRVWGNSVGAANRRAEDLASWARGYQARLDAEVARLAAEEAAREECGRIVAAWRESDDYAAGADPSGVCDSDGVPFFHAADLKHFAESLATGHIIRADEADEMSKARRWHEDAGGTWPFPETRTTFTDVPRHWVLAVDRDPKGTVPPGLRGAALAKWATEWRDSIAPLRGSEACVYAVPGQSVAFVTWWEKPMNRSAAREWCRRISPPCGEDDGPRFLAMPGEGWGERWPWRVPCAGLYLPSAHAEAQEAPRAASFARTTPATKLLTGIAALDTLFRGKPGIPVGARAVIKGDPKNCKTLVALEIAEAALASGWAVVWLACDEPDEQIAIRRLQRRGLSEAEAQDLPEQALAALDAEGQFDLYSGASLERLGAPATRTRRAAPSSWWSTRCRRRPARPPKAKASARAWRR